MRPILILFVILVAFSSNCIAKRNQRSGRVAFQALRNIENRFNNMYFDYDGESCNNTSCLNNGFCDGRKCLCTVMYYGRYCERFDYCNKNPCVFPYICQNTNQTYECVCPPGYTGIDCKTPIDYCASNPCQNYGNCTNVIRRHPSYICTCQDGFIGKNCEQINYCHSTSPLCFNKGQCINTVRGFICRCPRKFAGEQCERKLPLKKELFRMISS